MPIKHCAPIYPSIILSLRRVLLPSRLLLSPFSITSLISADELKVERLRRILQVKNENNKINHNNYFAR